MPRPRVLSCQRANGPRVTTLTTPLSISHNHNTRMVAARWRTTVHRPRLGIPSTSPTQPTRITRDISGHRQLVGSHNNKAGVRQVAQAEAEAEDGKAEAEAAQAEAVVREVGCMLFKLQTRNPKPQRCISMQGMMTTQAKATKRNRRWPLRDLALTLRVYKRAPKEASTKKHIVTNFRYHDAML